MIIEALTTFRAGRIIWETFEILHHVYIGKVTYQGASSITHLIQEKLNHWKNPNQQDEKKILYNFMTNDKDFHEKINEKINKYLTDLANSVSALEKAEISFSEVYKNLKDITSASDEKSFKSSLSNLNNEFKKFKNKFNYFLFSINIPPRQELYIADLLNQGVSNPGVSNSGISNSGISNHGVIEKFNNHLENINSCLNKMQKIKSDILITINENIASQSKNITTLSIEQLKQNISNYIHNLNPQSETTPSTSSTNIEFTDIRTAITQISAKLTAHTMDEQTEVWADNPNWWPLLTEKKQVEVGQRIFLHAMDRKYHATYGHSADKKLLLAQIFLRQHVSNYALDQVNIDLSAHELAMLLCDLQIVKCERLIDYLKRLEPGAMLPDQDPDGLLEWLKTKRKEQNPTSLFIEILVSPYCFYNLSLNSAIPKLQEMLPNASIEDLIENYKESYWGAIREKSDALIQISKSFKTKLLPRDYLLKDNQAESSHVVSNMMHELAKKLVTTLERLTQELSKNYNFLEGMVKSFNETKEKLLIIKKDQENKNGVERIEKLHQLIKFKKSPTNIFFPYFYNAKTINEAEKKQQVATLDDFLHVIYKGVDPNGICEWKDYSSQPSLESKQFLYHLLKSKLDDNSLEQVCIYIFQVCKANSALLFSNFPSFINCPLLAIENTPSSVTDMPILDKSTLSIDVILKDPNKISLIPDNSKALKEVSPKTKQEAETAFKQLQNYQVLALTRISPKYIRKLPFIEQLKHLLQSLFKSTLEIRQERLESVRIFIGDLYVVLSAEEADVIGQALDNFKKNYNSRNERAEKTSKSVLYNTMLRLINGPITKLINYFPIAEQKQLQESAAQFRETICELTQKNEKLTQENEELTHQVKEVQDKSEAKIQEVQAQRAKDKAESEAKLQEVQDKSEAKLQEVQAQLAKDKAEWETKFKELEAKFNQAANSTTEQSASNSSRSDESTSASSHNTGFFKP